VQVKHSAEQPTPFSACKATKQQHVQQPAEGPQVAASVCPSANERVVGTSQAHRLSLLLPPILQGVTGQQLLQLSDHRLLQLGVMDSAERSALLTARTQLQQEHAPDAGPAAQQPSSSLQADGKGSLSAITERSAASGQAWPGAASRPEDAAGLAADAQPDTPSANTLSRYVNDSQCCSM
jgi:hypothetical protein